MPRVPHLPPLSSLPGSIWSLGAGLGLVASGVCSGSPLHGLVRVERPLRNSSPVRLGEAGGAPSNMAHPHKLPLSPRKTPGAPTSHDPLGGRSGDGLLPKPTGCGSGRAEEKQGRQVEIPAPEAPGLLCSASALFNLFSWPRGESSPGGPSDKVGPAAETHRSRSTVQCPAFPEGQRLIGEGVPSLFLGVLGTCLRSCQLREQDS